LDAHRQFKRDDETISDIRIEEGLINEKEDKSLFTISGVQSLAVSEHHQWATAAECEEDLRNFPSESLSIDLPISIDEIKEELTVTEYAATPSCVEETRTAVRITSAGKMKIIAGIAAIKKEEISAEPSEEMMIKVEPSTELLTKLESTDAFVCSHCDNNYATMEEMTLHEQICFHYFVTPRLESDPKGHQCEVSEVINGDRIVNNFVAFPVLPAEFHNEDASDRTRELLPSTDAHQGKEIKGERIETVSLRCEMMTN
jgi:hypothetical protein